MRPQKARRPTRSRQPMEVRHERRSGSSVVAGAYLRRVAATGITWHRAAKTNPHHHRAGVIGDTGTGGDDRRISPRRGARAATQSRRHAGGAAVAGPHSLRTLGAVLVLAPASPREAERVPVGD